MLHRLQAKPQMQRLRGGGFGRRWVLLVVHLSVLGDVDLTVTAPVAAA
jgi:hypothetical protein